MKESILKEFDENTELYRRYAERCQGILIELIRDQSLNVHHITARVKSKDSLEKKIDVKKDKYIGITEITDVCGIRIITYLDSDVSKVAEIIEKEFVVDQVNSIDKRKLKTDQFGYRSLHYVVSLSNERIGLSENKKFLGIKCEIQIRSILQHAWAEIEHDLGYKGEIAIPENFKRNFNRIAALLETADVEFDRLKSELSEYELMIGKIIENNPNEVKIDKISISSFISTNIIFENARDIIKKNSGCVFDEREDLTGELERFELFKIYTIGELEDIIEKHVVHFLAFVNLFSEDVKAKNLSYSLPLFYFQHFLAAKTQSEDFINEYFNYGSISMGGGRSAQSFIDIFNNSKKKQE